MSGAKRTNATRINGWLVESVGLPNGDDLCEYLAAILIEHKKKERNSLTTTPRVLNKSLSSD